MTGPEGDDQHGAGRQANQLTRHSSDEGGLQQTVATGSNDDELSALLVGHLGQALCRPPRDDPSLNVGYLSRGAYSIEKGFA